MAGQRVVVTGAGGNLGRDLLGRLGLYDDLTVLGLTRTDLDLTWPSDRVVAVLDRLNPDVVINGAALTSVDDAERQPEVTHAVNAQGPHTLASWVADRHRYLVHLSTDYVFDGTQVDRPYRPSDQTHPINVYGRTKLAGEAAVQAVAPESSTIVRTSWLFGSGTRNFVPFLVQAAREQRPVQVAMDQVGTPTWTGSLSKMLLEVLETRPQGIVHGVCRGHATRFEQAEAICLYLGVPTTFMTPITTEALNLPARRPLHSWLETSFESAPEWQAATQKYLSVQGYLPAYA